ncbi:MAG: Polysaccharide biosynthesis protein [Chloroflexota bacterium]|jgi:O-antigen/teichoic acid export membrane protein|nr:Polysaccharide biosynthesis protein [Chloroflexota bacterium]
MASVDPEGLADRSTALVGWTIAWRAASAIATLTLGAFLIRRLPAAEYGRYTFVLSVLVYIALLATFGQDQGLLRYLPEVLGRGDRAAAHDLLRKSAIAIIAVWLVTSGLVFLFRPQIDAVLNAHVADLLALGTVLLLGGIAAGVLSFALVAIYDMRSQAIATPIAGALTLGLAVLFLQHGRDIRAVLVAGAVGQSALALTYLVILLRRVRRAQGIPGDRVGWRRLLVYASGWLPSLLIASAVGLQFENVFLLRFAGSTAVAYYDTGYNIPQRLVSLIPSLLTGAWVVGTLEGWRHETTRVRTSVMAFYKGIFLVAFPLAFAGSALLAPVIRVYTSGRLPPAEQIAPVMLLFFVAALLATPWGLVVRVRELAWLNALITIAQLGFAALADFWLIQSFALWGAVVAVGLTTILTLVLTFGAWWAFDRATMAIPWAYAARCALAASPYLLLLPLAFVRLPTRLLLPAAVLGTAVTTIAWAYLIRRLDLLSNREVPLLHRSRHGPIRLALRHLAPSDR